MTFPQFVQQYQVTHHEYEELKWYLMFLRMKELFRFFGPRR